MKLRGLILLSVVACSKEDKDAAKHFCQHTRSTFSEMMEMRFLDIEQTAGPPDCERITRAGDFARGLYIGFRAAAAPFRYRPEVGRVYDVLDGESARHNMLDELRGLRCTQGERAHP